MTEGGAWEGPPADDLIRELYARFGLAYYHSECLHRGLCIGQATADLPRRDLITRPRVEERLARAFSLTLGDVVGELEGALPADLLVELQRAVGDRNFLAHRFWFEQAHMMFSEADVRQLIAELDEASELFQELDERVDGFFQTKRRELGLTDETLQEYLRKILSGQTEEPLPGRQEVRQTEKKLNRQQRLVRVWEFSLDDGGKPLIFEFADGSLWQLCDVGLGWTRFKEIGSDWTEHPVTRPHLPADITPRPTVSAPWDYEFQLGKGAVLWVRPGRQPKTFKWGVRKSGRPKS